MTAVEVRITGVPTETAEAIREAYDAGKGERLAETVLAMAEAGDPRLRGYFQWDDTTAARAYRVEQANALVRRVKVTVVQEEWLPPITARAYVSQRGDPDRPAGAFVAVEEVVGDAAQQALLETAIRLDLERLVRKYRDVELLFSLAGDVFG